MQFSAFSCLCPQVSLLHTSFSAIHSLSSKSVLFWRSSSPPHHYRRSKCSSSADDGKKKAKRYDAEDYTYDKSKKKAEEKKKAKAFDDFDDFDTKRFAVLSLSQFLSKGIDEHKGWGQLCNPPKKFHAQSSYPIPLKTP